jgi:hypothetical protein
MYVFTLLSSLFRTPGMAGGGRTAAQRRGGFLLALLRAFGTGHA